MRFRILGTIEVWDDRRQLRIGGPKQVALLAFLLLHANRAVSSDALIDALWPRSALNRDAASKPLQMAVARLRKVLEPLSAGGRQPTLRTVRGGYLLHVAPGEVDADAFERHVAAGRQALEAGDAA